MFSISDDERAYINYSEFLFKCLLMNCSKGEEFIVRLWTDSGQSCELTENRRVRSLENVYRYICAARTHEIIADKIHNNCQKYWWKIDKVVPEGDRLVSVMRCTVSTGGRIISRTINDKFLCFYHDERVINAYNLYQFLTHKSEELPGPAKVDACKFYVGDMIQLEGDTSKEPTYAVYIGELEQGKYRCIAKRASDAALNFTACYSLEELEKFKEVAETPYDTLPQIQELILQDPFYYYKWLFRYSAAMSALSELNRTDDMEKIVASDLKSYKNGDVYFK